MTFHFTEKHGSLFLFPGLSLVFENHVSKNAGFSWRRPFQTKLLFFETMRSAKRAFALRADFNRVIQENLHFSMSYLYKTKEKTGKNTGENTGQRPRLNAKINPIRQGEGGWGGGGGRKRTR